MTDIAIAGRPIGTAHAPFIIAEAGINHNGERQKAFAMIHAAKAAGADAVKFQTFKAAEFCGDPNQMFTYKSQGKDVTESMLAMFTRYELSREDWFVIRAECDRAGIVFMSTPQNRGDLDLLLEIGIPAVKIGSDDFTNLPLLKSYAQTKLPIIMSCGMADLGEVYRSLEAVGALDGYPVVLLLCTSQYPTPPVDANLRKLSTLRAAFPALTLGFSDHTQGPLASSLATALGAAVFEKHFTLDHDLPGPDHWFSETPDTLREWVTAIRTAHVMLGSPVVRPTAAERDMRVLARRSITAARDIRRGDICTEDNIGLRRPGNGLAPGLLDYVLGGKAVRDIKSGELLKFGDVEK
ncbi:MAG TPA: N-acetylneuraminate synthase family protein [Rhizomicrobium sp.]|nr:N-acetylneuraminate synthase family protein [Rhizomicrobium sp.]